MKKEFKLQAGRFPSKREIMAEELANQFYQTVMLGETFSQKFVPNENQKEIFDIINTSQVPEGETLHILLYGGAGSGKTSGALAYALDIMLRYATSRILCIRRTQTELKGSIMKDCMEWLVKYGILFTPNQGDMTITLENGSEFWMRSDKSLVPGKQNTSRALGGTQYVCALVEEVDTVSIETISAIPHRLRQNVGSEGFRRVVFYTCNPPSRGSWIHDLWFKKHNPHDPASAYRAVKCDIRKNLHHLPTGYMQSIARDYEDDEAMRERFLEGNFAPDTRGDVMFKRQFSRKIHVAPSAFTKEWNRGYPMQRGWDFGNRGNAMVVVQDDKDRQQIRIFAAVLGRYVMFDNFCKEWMSWCYRTFPGAEWEDYADPAGSQQTAMGLSYHDIMRSNGIYPRSTKEDTAYGCSLIAQRLLTLVPGGRPEILINPVPETELIIEGFSSGYCNDKDSLTDEFKPVKDGVYDHVMDAFRYTLIHLRRMGEEVVPRWRNQQDRYVATSMWSDGPSGRPVGARYSFGRSNFI